MSFITTAALAAAIAIPATVAARPYEDLHPPVDTPATADASPSAYQDLRSPDAKDAALASQSSYQDLRSPDARDVGRTPVQVPEPVVAIREVPGTGFDWGDAGIGAAGILALFSIAGGLALMVSARRRRGFHVST
jgi:hypothetical protein